MTTYQVTCTLLVALIIAFVVSSYSSYKITKLDDFFNAYGILCLFGGISVALLVIFNVMWYMYLLLLWLTD